MFLLACSAITTAAPTPELGTSPVQDTALEADAARGPDIAALIEAGDVKRAQQLLERQPAASPEVQRAFLAACRKGDRTLMAQALAADANPNDKAAPLTLAAQRNDTEAVDLLLSYGADCAQAPGALHAALEHKNTAMATRLLQGGADPNGPNAAGLTPLAMTLKSGELDLARVMFSQGGYPDDFVEPAIANADTSLLDALFQYGLSPDTRDAAGNPLLVRAAMEGKPEVAKFLLEKGADPKKPGKEGQAAFHLAAVQKNEPLMLALLQGGADANQPFYSPLKEEFLNRIEDESFKKWLKRDTGLTPLMLAASRGDTSMIKLLLANGAKRGAQSKSWQRYPVVFACEKENIPAAQLLLGRNPEPEEPVHRVTISLSKQRATLYKDDEVVRTSRVSTGRKGYATPTGKYVITDKQRDWISTIYKVGMPFFMRLSCREIGLHAGNCPGYPASHGCIRMPRADVQAFYGKLKIGDAVTIED